MLLVGHGTRDLAGRDEFLSVVAGVAARLAEVVVEPCFLELAEPSIEQGVSRLAAAQVSQFVVLPLLLFAGGHARRDIPKAVALAARSCRADWRFGQAAHLGCQSSMVRLSLERFHAARWMGGGDGRRADLCGAAPIDSSVNLKPFHVLIGRGGTDAEALDEMRQFARLLNAAEVASGSSLGFLAGNGLPTLADALDVAEGACAPGQTVVVQPHLLFRGRLVDQVREEICRRVAGQRQLVWKLADHLGPDPAVIATLVENYWGYVDIATCADSA